MGLLVEEVKVLSRMKMKKDEDEEIKDEVL